MVEPRDRLIRTLFVQSRLRSSALELTHFLAVDLSERAFGSGPSLRSYASERLWIDLGVQLLAGRSRKQALRDVCPDRGFDCLADPTGWNAGQTQVLNRGLRSRADAPFFPQSFADHQIEQRDEVWIALTLEF